MAEFEIMVQWAIEPAQIGKDNGNGIKANHKAGCVAYSVGRDSYALTRVRHFSNFYHLESNQPGLKRAIERDLRRRPHFAT